MRKEAAEVVAAARRITLQTYDGYRSAHRDDNANPTESQVSLQQALTTLRAIRRRYATGREAHPEARFFSAQLALGSADMFWLTAAIEALEKSVAVTASEADEAAVQGRPET